MTPCIVSIGEVLWDLLPGGAQLGGAPANLAVHARSLGAEVALVSRVGNDELGRRAVTFLRDRGVETRAISVDSDLPTGTVGVELDAAGHARYEIHAPVAWDAIPCDAHSLELAKRADAICFGSLAQRTAANRESIHALVSAARRARIRLCDINLRDPFHDRAVIESSLKAANVLKLNETELPILSSHFGGSGEVDEQLAFLADQFELQMILLTLGSKGSRVWTAGQVIHEPGRRVAVQDTVGAGDSFTAAFILGVLRNWPLETTLARASEIAAYVCTRSGATPVLPPHLVQPFLQTGPAYGQG